MLPIDGPCPNSLRQSMVRSFSRHVLTVASMETSWPFQIVLIEVRDGRVGQNYQNGWNFGKLSNGGGGHFQSKNLCCRFWKLLTGLFKHEIDKKESNIRVQGVFFQQLYWEKSDWSLSLEIMYMYFILSGPHTSLHMSHSQMFQKVESGWGPFFKVVLEC